MIVTRDFIMQHRTVNRAWTRKQLAIIGIPWPPTNGWIDRVAGRHITNDEADAFVEAVNDIAPSTERVRNRRQQEAALNAPKTSFVGEYMGFERCIGMSHEEAVDAQAGLLLLERVAIFGADWHIGCAVRIPAALKALIAKHGTDVLLLMLDKEVRDE